MKEFLDSKAGRTLIIAFVAAGVTTFAVDWDNGFVDVARAAGGAFFGALTPLVAYLKLNSNQAAAAPPPPSSPLAGQFAPSEIGSGIIFTTPVSRARHTESRANVDRIPAVDFDQPYHRSPVGIAHPGDHAEGCGWCAAEVR